MMSDKRKGNAILCLFWGESDAPIAVLAKSDDEVREAIADNWLGESEGDEMEELLAEIRDNDFSERKDVEYEFEIGGAKFSDVFAY
jgi:hypothetical protein